MSYSGVDPSVTVTDTSDDRGTSVIDRHSEIDGTYSTSRDLRIEGLLTGSVKCDGVLFIADGAIVDATVDAASVIVSGQLSGNIRCRGRLEITATGSVGGEVETAALVIVEGARYEGEINMSGNHSASTDPAALAPAPGSGADESDAHSLLRRFTSTPPVESRDESPASTLDEDEEEE